MSIRSTSKDLSASANPSGLRKLLETRTLVGKQQASDLTMQESMMTPLGPGVGKLQGLQSLCLAKGNFSRQDLSDAARTFGNVRLDVGLVGV